MEIKENIIYNCDCLELMREMEKQGIIADWLITDPPYGINVDGPIGGKGVCDNIQYTQKNWDKERISKEYFDLMFKVSKNQIIFGANYYTDILPPCKSLCVWDKRINETDRNNFADCEFIYVSQGISRVFRYQYKGMLQGDMKNKDERFHPTQKPTQIIVKLINYYTKENDLILDPFMGSFTTAVACHKTGRRYIGAELDKEYFDKGTERLSKVKSQISLFDIINKQRRA